ncbi:MAG: hypothetical protein KJO85_09690 [Gammaproteobacteria bacterium]|nr:hypothetical protein [Gammaproteobacteria bacterium]
MQRLRDLVMGEEKQRLHKLDRRVTDLEARTADVAEVLPAAMSRLAQDPVNRPDFERPVVNTIRSAIKRDSHSFAEALFPVLGPAIRRAVADALKGLVQRINVALENSFTIKGLKWRLEAARSGEPFAQIVLRHTMLYAVQEAFLIQRGSGLVLASVHRDETLALDEDAVAAMLTAIQSFIQDSFGETADEPLRSAELGDRTMWVINGPVAVLACVISGTPPRATRDELMNLLETLHARFGQRFRDDFDGLAENEGLKALLNEALLEEVDTEARNASRFKFRFMWWAAGLLLAGFILYSIFSHYRLSKDRDVAASLFTAQAGYVVTSADTKDGKVKLQGLRDPASVAPEQVISGQDISPDRIVFDFRPYQSLDEAIVTARLGRQLGLNDPASLELEQGMLRVTGALTSAQLKSLEEIPMIHPAIDEVDLEGSRLAPGEATKWLRAALNAPESVRFLADGNTIRVDGQAESGWIKMALEASVDTQGWELDFMPLVNGLKPQLDASLERLNGQVFLFSSGTRLREQSIDALRDAAQQLVLAQQMADILGAPLKLTLEGLGDGIDTFEKNRAVAQSRSDRLRDELASLGVDVDAVIHTMGPWEGGGLNPEHRKVTLWVERGEMNGQ